jgi:dUTP pyrophosphatase
MIIDIKILDERIKEMLPSAATMGSAAVDLRACIDEEILLMPGKAVLIPTGFAMHIMDCRYAGVILPRSGLGHKEGLILGNGTGLIDSDYQGQIMVSLLNRNQDHYDDFNIKKIRPMDRIAQLIIIPVQAIQFNIVSEFDASERGCGGFGSTGK